jgi:hypothetical protein
MSQGLDGMPGKYTTGGKHAGSYKRQLSSPQSTFPLQLSSMALSQISEKAVRDSLSKGVMLTTRLSVGSGSTALDVTNATFKSDESQVKILLGPSIMSIGKGKSKGGIVILIEAESFDPAVRFPMVCVVILP